MLDGLARADDHCGPVIRVGRLPVVQQSDRAHQDEETTMTCKRAFCRGTIVRFNGLDGPEDRCHQCGRAPAASELPKPAPIERERCQQCGFIARSHSSLVQHITHAHEGKSRTRKGQQGLPIALTGSDRALQGGLQQQQLRRALCPRGQAHWVHVLRQNPAGFAEMEALEDEISAQRGEGGHHSSPSGQGTLG